MHSADQPFLDQCEGYTRLGAYTSTIVLTTIQQESSAIKVYLHFFVNGL